MKKKATKLAGQERQSLYQTGGGVPTIPPEGKLDPLSQRILDMGVVRNPLPSMKDGDSDTGPLLLDEEDTEEMEIQVSCSTFYEDGDSFTSQFSESPAFSQLDTVSTLPAERNRINRCTLSRPLLAATRTCQPVSSSPIPAASWCTLSSPLLAATTTCHPVSSSPLPAASQPISSSPLPAASQPVSSRPLPAASQPVSSSPLPAASQPVSSSPLPAASQPVSSSPLPAASQPAGNSFSQPETVREHTSRFSKTPNKARLIKAYHEKAKRRAPSSAKAADAIESLSLAKTKMVEKELKLSEEYNAGIQKKDLLPPLDRERQKRASA